MLKMTTTNDEHVGVVPSAGSSKLKEPITVVPVEVDYVLQFLIDWLGLIQVFYWLTKDWRQAAEDDLDTGPVVLNIIEVPPKIAHLGFLKVAHLGFKDLIDSFSILNLKLHLFYSCVVWLNSVMAL